MNRISVFAVVLLSVAVFGQGGPPGAARQVGRPTGASLAELVPASTGVFIEFADLQSHYPPSGSPAVWRAAVKLIGLEGDPVGDGGVGGPIGSQLGLSTESAVAALFGRRVAVALPSMGRLEEGVLLARLPGPRGLGTVLKAGPWESRRARGRLRYYVLDSGLSMATDGRTVVIGQDLPEHPFMRSCLDLLGRRKGRSLAAAKPFIMLTERFPDRCAGLAYVDWGGGEGPGSVAVPGSGLLFAALRRGAVACVAGEDGLHLELSAEAADRAGVMAFGAARGGGAGRPALPKDIWLAATVDASPGELLTWVHSKSASGPGALFIQLLGGAMVGAQPDDNLMDYLEAPTTLVVGVPQRSGAGLGRPGLPRAALVMGTQAAGGRARRRGGRGWPSPGGDRRRPGCSGPVRVVGSAGRRR